MEEVIRFVTLVQTDRFTITDLCEQFGISRKTAYKHLERYAAGGLKALQPRSHRPHYCPQRTNIFALRATSQGRGSAMPMPHSLRTYPRKLPILNPLFPSTSQPRECVSHVLMALLQING